MKTLPIAVQVYSVRDDAQKDFKGTIQKLKDIGYDAVELAGLYDIPAAEIRRILDEAGIPAISAHVPFRQLLSDPEKVIGDYVTIGVKYIAIPYLEESDRPGTDNFSSTVESIREIAKTAKEMGIITLYHNHDFEFIKMPDGQYALDYLYEQIPADLLQTEIDTCWVNVAGENPVQYIEKYSGRSPVVHLKDFYKEGHTKNMYELIGTQVKKEEGDSGLFEFRPVGSGMQDFPSILQASIDAGSEWVVVEQDQSNGCTPMEAVTMSREYLKSLGW